MRTVPARRVASMDEIVRPGDYYGPTDMWKIFTFLGIVQIVVQGGIVRRAIPRFGEKAVLLAGGERAAAIYSLIVTAKLNDLDPQAWLADVLRRIADHPASRLHELLPWNWRKQDQHAAAAA